MVVLVVEEGQQSAQFTGELGGLGGVCGCLVVGQGGVVVGELVWHVLGEPAAEELCEFGKAGVPFPVGLGDGGWRRHVAVGGAVFEVFGDAEHPLLDLGVGEAEVGEGEELSQHEAEFARRVFGVPS